MNKRHNGFTIVELLIVIVVIGILAAITIVSFRGIQNRAHDTTVQSDLAQFDKQLSIYNVDNSSYPGVAAFIAALGFKASKSSYDAADGNFVYCVAGSGSTARYVALAKSKSGKVYYQTSTGKGISTNPWTGDHYERCIPYGITNTDSGYFGHFGFHPAGWGNPGWKTWIGG